MHVSQLHVVFSEWDSNGVHAACEVKQAFSSIVISQISNHAFIILITRVRANPGQVPLC